MKVQYVPPATRWTSSCWSADNGATWIDCSGFDTSYISSSRSVNKPAKLKHRQGKTWLARPYTRTVYVSERLIDDEVIVRNTGNNRLNRTRGRKSTIWSASDLGNICSPGRSPNSTTYSNLTARVETEARANLAKADVNIGQSLAESRETAAMIAESAAKLALFIRLVSKRDFRSIPRLLGWRTPGKGFANSWLAYQYGWRPLMSDIHGLHAEFQKGLALQPQTLVSSSRASSTDQVVLSPGGVYPYSDVATLIGKRECAAECCITYKVSDASVARLSGLGLLNPASIAWELVPWSFVVDWFIPVGTFLEALTSTAGLTFVTGSLSKRTTFEFSGKLPILGSTSGSTYVSHQNGTGRCQGLNLTRTVYGTFPTPRPYLNLNPFSSTRMINALALIRTNSRLFSRN